MLTVHTNGQANRRILSAAAWGHSRTRWRGRAATGALVALVVLAGCAQSVRRPPAGSVDADKFLFDRGTQALDDHKWVTAREYFREIVDNYPQSRFRADAKLGVGDSYLGEGTTEARVLAINEFREFLNFFPTSPRADYAQYKLGLAHYQQMRRPERDQTETKAAITEFEAFLERYPNSQLTDEVKAKLREAKDRLGEADYKVGLFYYRAKWYPGAIDRFKAVLARDPEYSYRDALYYYLAESLIKMNNPAEALPYFERLVSEFAQSEYLEEAKRRIAELKSDHDTHKH